jgi:hypothetical protein
VDGPYWDRQVTGSLQSERPDVSAAIVVEIGSTISLYLLANIRSVYKMGQSTFLIALIHFASELFIFQSIKLNRASISPLIIARESRIAFSLMTTATLR